MKQTRVTLEFLELRYKGFLEYHSEISKGRMSIAFGENCFATSKEKNK